MPVPAGEEVRVTFLSGSQPVLSQSSTIVSPKPPEMDHSSDCRQMRAAEDSGRDDDP